MTFVDDVSQKMKGRGQKIRGKIRSGRVSGSIDQIKGSVNETIADAKLRTRAKRP